jgi:hypothetical protein
LRLASLGHEGKNKRKNATQVLLPRPTFCDSEFGSSREGNGKSDHCLASACFTRCICNRKRIFSSTPCFLPSYPTSLSLCSCPCIVYRPSSFVAFDFASPSYDALRYLCLCSTHRTLIALHSQPPSDSRMEPVYPRHNNEYDPSAQAVPSQAGINPISPVNGTQRTGTPTMPMDSRMSQQQPMQFSNSNGGQQAIGVGNGNGEFEEPRRNKFLDILCCRMH